MGSSIDSSFQRAKDSKFVFFFFFLYREISKDRYLFEIGDQRKKKKESKKYSHVKTNRNRAHCIN